jgi:hypothetical protein
MESELIEVELSTEESKEVDLQKENYIKHGKVVKWERVWMQAIYEDGYRETYDEIGKPPEMFWN